MGERESRHGARLTRRQLIQRGAIAAGAAWVAPTVLSMNPAGAQASTCYSFKLTGSGCSCTGETGDPSCGADVSPAGQTFEAAIAATGASAACPPAGTITSLSSCDDDGSITVRSGCTVEFLQVKRGGQPGPTPPTCTTQCYQCGATTVNWTNPVANAISHLNVIICCTS
jgi:hypothetical protein